MLFLYSLFSKQQTATYAAGAAFSANPTFSHGSVRAIFDSCTITGNQQIGSAGGGGITQPLCGFCLLNRLVTDTISYSCLQSGRRRSLSFDDREQRRWSSQQRQSDSLLLNLLQQHRIRYLLSFDRHQSFLRLSFFFFIADIDTYIYESLGSGFVPSVMFI